MKIHAFSNIINDIINTYFDNNVKNQIMTYFRIFYVFFVINKYIFKYTTNTEEETKKIFISFYFHSIDKNKNNNKIIFNNIMTHFSFFYDTFFRDENIYFSTYFNNLIKYCLPVPNEFEIYNPIITYRNNVSNIYKKNNFDYLDIITEYDMKLINSNYNKDVKLNEIDIHIPIKYFDNKNIVNTFDNLVFYIAVKNVIYITNKCYRHENKLNFDIIYKRTINTFDKKFFEQFNNNIPFELLFSEWTKSNENIEIELQNICYISVNKKISTIDLFRVFNKIDITMDKFKYLFHDTKLNLSKEQINNEFLINPTYLYFTPLLPDKNILKYTKDRHCLIFKLKNNINNVADLTRTIVSDNPFTNYLINKDKNKHIWKQYDNNKIMDYYENKNLDIVDSDFACITTNNKDNINDFIRMRPYCDINSKDKYTGKRKFLEIIFKTRKYTYSQIWLFYHIDKYIKYGYKNKINNINLLYHPSKTQLFNSNLDIHITDFCKKINLSAFFSTDHDITYKTGGEIMITKPIDFITTDKILQNLCYVKHL